MAMRKRNGMLERSCPNRKTKGPECLFDSSLVNVLISFISAGTPTMVKSEVNDTNANIAATLVAMEAKE